MGAIFCEVCLIVEQQQYKSKLALVKSKEACICGSANYSSGCFFYCSYFCTLAIYLMSEKGEQENNKQ